MGVMSTLDHDGDQRVMWDRTQPDEVAAARRTFDDLRKKGYAAYRAEGKRGDRGEVIREFDPDAERIILTKPLQGGLSVPGLGCTCGACHTCYQREWRRRNPGKVKAAKQKWGKTRDRAGDPQAARYNHEYGQRNITRILQRQKQSREQDPRKERARDKARKALRSGKLIRQPCEVCGSERVNAHHEDYDKPMDITWLCPKHHRQRHVQLAQGG